MKFPLRTDYDSTLRDADGKAVATATMSDFGAEKDLVNLDELAKRANAFDALLKACKEALSWIGEGGVFLAMSTLKDAIKKAEGKEDGHATGH